MVTARGFYRNGRQLSLQIRTKKLWTRSCTTRGCLFGHCPNAGSLQLELNFIYRQRKTPQRIAPLGFFRFVLIYITIVQDQGVPFPRKRKRLLLLTVLVSSNDVALIA